MACCMMVPSRYLKMLTTSNHQSCIVASPEGIFTGNGPDVYLRNEFDNYYWKVKILTASPGANELITFP